MIPVEKQTEPPDFDKKVRQPGLRWLKKNGVPAKSSDLPALWQTLNEELYDRYSGVCAYLAFHFEWVSGASSTDHFVAKSNCPNMAYEWENYRLACLGANRAKNKYDDVLDPFEVRQETFYLNLSNGEIRLNPKLKGQYKKLAEDTINRLGLNSQRLNDMRANHYSQYLRHKDKRTLQELNPFVYYEAKRQGLL